MRYQQKWGKRTKRVVSQKPSEENPGEGNDRSSTMWTEDWPLDLTIGEVTSGLDKSHFRGRMGK